MTSRAGRVSGGTERDALVFREMGDGAWVTRRVAGPRLAAYLEGGWSLLISASDVRANDIADAYLSEQLAPFNHPRVLSDRA